MLSEVGAAPEVPHLHAAIISPRNSQVLVMPGKVHIPHRGRMRCLHSPRHSHAPRVPHLQDNLNLYDANWHQGWSQKAVELARGWWPDLQQVIRAGKSAGIVMLDQLVQQPCSFRGLLSAWVF